MDRAQKEKQKQEEATNAALAEEFDEIQARMDADHELVVRLTHEEQEKYTIEERITLLAEYFERRKKQLAAKREFTLADGWYFDMLQHVSREKISSHQGMLKKIVELKPKLQLRVQ
ncbi:hypothetical protein Tco_1265682 [Tanacetum coccineum]